MAIKYLATGRLQGTEAERLALSSVDTSATPTVNSDFSCTASNTASPPQTCGGWTYIRNNSNYTASGKMHVTWKRSGTLYMSSYDLGASTTEDFVLRFEIQPRTQSWETGDQRFLFVGLSSNALDGSTVAQDFHGALLRGDDSNGAYCANIGTNHDLVSAPNWCNGETSLGEEWDKDTPKTYFFEITRVGTNAKVSLYPNNSYGTATSTTGNQTIQKNALRYIKFCSWESGSTDGEMEAEVDNVKYWGESHPNLPNGTIFEESDTGKHMMFDGTSAWNEMT